MYYEPLNFYEPAPNILSHSCNNYLPLKTVSPPYRLRGGGCLLKKNSL